MRKGHLLKLFSLLLFLIFSFLYSSDNTYATNSFINTPATLSSNLGKIPDGQEDLFYHNNIMFYEWCPNGGDSGGTCTAPTGDQITWIGDSYSCGAKDEIIAQLPGVDIGTGTCGPRDNNIQGSKHFTKSVENDTETGGGWSGLKIAQKLKDEDKIRSYLVFALGTNDAGGTKDNIKKEVEELINIVGEDTKIILTTLYTAADNDYTARNDAYKEMADEKTNVYVADWAATAKPEYYNQDSSGIHPIGNYDKWVKVIKEALPQSCNGAGLIEDINNLTHVWNLLVQANIPGLSDNSAAISGIVGNIFAESSGDPFSDGLCVGIFQQCLEPAKSTIRSRISGLDRNSQDGINKALEIEVNYAIENGGIQSYVDALDAATNKDGEKGAAAYAELWLVVYERAVSSACGGTDAALGDIEDPGVLEYQKNMYSGRPNCQGCQYQGIARRRDTAKEYFNEYGSSGTSSSTTSSSGSTSSSITWDDEGWITGGVSGYKKDATTQGEGDFQTKTPNGDVGPNKITLHSTEGGGSNWDSALSIYGCGPGCSAHFTINIKDKQVYQHHPIFKHSGALWDYNDVVGGVQIEIVGFSTSDHSSSDWYLKNFSDSDWDYLAALLIGISNKTGIPLTSSLEWKDNNENSRLDQDGFKNYTGILGHMHAYDGKPACEANNSCETHSDPGAIWDKVSAAIGRGGGSSDTASECDNGDGNNTKCTNSGQEIADMAKKLAWETLPSDPKAGKDEFIEAFKKAGYSGTDYTNCNQFAATVIIASGADPNFETGRTDKQYEYLKGHQDKWQEIDWNGDESKLQPGDVLNQDTDVSGDNGSYHHSAIYIGDGKVAEASQGEHSGAIYTLSDWHKSQAKMHAFRIKGDDNCNLSDGLSDEQAQKLADYYNSNKVKVTGFSNKNNCVGFSAFFVSWLTDLSNPDENPTSGDGYAVAGNLISKYGLPESGNPQAFSVFSTTPGSFHSSNHTGVIVRVNDDGTVTTIESACNNTCDGGDGWGRGFPSGAGNAVVWTNQTLPSLTYAYFSDHINTSKLNEIINK